MQHISYLRAKAKVLGCNILCFAVQTLVFYVLKAYLLHPKLLAFARF